MNFIILKYKIKIIKLLRIYGVIYHFYKFSKEIKILNYLPHHIMLCMENNILILQHVKFQIVIHKSINEIYMV